jgi:NAD(P)-dependent dehydrogenase (short-subunit alcohol dehydrogenase family)
MLSTEFSRRNLDIRVNCICPGYFPSVRPALYPQDSASGAWSLIPQGMSVKEFGSKSAEEEAKFFRSPEGYGIPFGRVGTAKDYAQLMLMIVNVSTPGIPHSGFQLKIRMDT